MTELKAQTNQTPKNGPDQGKAGKAQPKPATDKKPEELGGPKGPEPTRYNDWEQGGRCTDF